MSDYDDMDNRQAQESERAQYVEEQLNNPLFKLRTKIAVQILQAYMQNASNDSEDALAKKALRQADALMSNLGC